MENTNTTSNLILPIKSDRKHRVRRKKIRTSRQRVNDTYLARKSTVARIIKEICTIIHQSIIDGATIKFDPKVDLLRQNLNNIIKSAAQAGRNKYPLAPSYYPRKKISLTNPS